ncbi:unnamed protein product [Dibothriocephalus latus]|uniref:Uncharacterized protein n=1 Tax=Dibothriocephalus latus TaxID=60516 RepID=A0A3P6R0Z1_DIBLA|nr:unnamed protein product [Dibothriocephalus latus]
MCLKPCAENILKTRRPICPVCRIPFTRVDLKPFLFYNQLQNILPNVKKPEGKGEKKVEVKLTCGNCAECGRPVGDREKDLRAGTLFSGLICADCQATERLINSAESCCLASASPNEDSIISTQSSVENDAEFCLDVTCSGQPKCKKTHICVMAT